MVKIVMAMVSRILMKYGQITTRLDMQCLNDTSCPRRPMPARKSYLSSKTADIYWDRGAEDSVDPIHS